MALRAVLVLTLAITLSGIGGADADPPQKEPRRIIGILIAIVAGHPEVSGQIISRHEVGHCINRVPVQIYTKNDDGTPVRVAVGDTNGDGAFSIEIPNQAGTYVAVARALRVNLGSGNDTLKCKMARSEPVQLAADGEVEDYAPQS